MHCESFEVSVFEIIELDKELFSIWSLLCNYLYREQAVADPGFPRGGGANSPGGRQHTILPNFPKNCMKLKEFGPQGGARPKFYYVDPPLNR